MKLSLHWHGRSRILAAGLILVMAIFVVQLFYLQIIRHNDYERQAVAEHTAKFVIPAERGKIYAKEGDTTVPLVLNEPVYLAYADPQEVTNRHKLISAFERIAGGNLEGDFKTGLNSKKLRYVVIAKKLNLKQAQLLKKENIAGVGFTEGTERVYPEGSLAGQLLGYVNADGKGQYGIEGALNKELSGRDGKLQAVTDVRRIPLTIGDKDTRVAPKNGENLVLTIDRSIQDYTEQALKRGLDRAGATTGGVVVMDPKNGNVLAMANAPTYNPQDYNKVTDYSVFQNDIVSDPIEVGSVMKTLTMAAGLDSGAVNINSTFNNTGSVKIDDATISNVEGDPTSPHQTMLEILQYSLNTGAVYVLQQMGGGQVNLQAREKLYNYFTNHYMFGKDTGIQQAGEEPGIVIGPHEVQGNNVRYANMVFGQGLNTTVIQVASAFSAAINGGTYYRPNLVAGTMQSDGAVSPHNAKVVRKDVINSKASATLRNMIYQARQLGVTGGQDKHGYIVGGKTGTAQTIDPTTGKYRESNATGTYLGFGGNQTPHYVIMVYVKDSKLPGYAGNQAANPIFTDISNWLLDYLKVQPVGH